MMITQVQLLNGMSIGAFGFTGHQVLVDEPAVSRVYLLIQGYKHWVHFGRMPGGKCSKVENGKSVYQWRSLKYVASITICAPGKAQRKGECGRGGATCEREGVSSGFLLGRQI